MMSKKMLYIASTVGHLKSFHLPYLKRFAQEGWTVHIAGKNAHQLLPGADAGFDISFEKSMFSPKNLQAVRQIRKLLQRERYDVISVHTSLAAFFTRLAVLLSSQRPVVINTVHGYLFDDNTGWMKRKLLLWAEKLTAPCTDLLLTMNCQDTRIARENRLCRGEIVQIDGMGVDFSRFSPADEGQRRSARQTFGIPEDAFVLVYAAEFSGRKNQAALIRALSKLPEDVWLLLAGRGQMLDSCKSLAQQLGVAERVVFAGFVSDIERCYCASDVCVSTSRSEGLPFNLMEAMHCALPVIATKVKGHEDLVQDGKSGFLVPFGDEDRLCLAVQQLMAAPGQCRSFGKAGMATAQQYALERVLEVNIQLFHDFIREYRVNKEQEY